MNLFNTERYLHKNEIQGQIPHFKKVLLDVIKIVWPAMIEAFLVALVTMFDGIMVSEISNSASAAVTLTKQPIYLMLSFITALNICVTALMARRKGEQDSNSANRIIHTSIVISTIISILLTIVFLVFIDPILWGMGANKDTFTYAKDYLTIITIGFIFNALRLTICSYFRGVGNTHISLYTNIIANVINIFFNYCLIMGRLGFPRLELKGAAIATVIGNFVAFIISLLISLHKDPYTHFSFKKLFKINFNDIKVVTKLLPSATIEQMVMRIGFILFAIIVNYLGTNATYVHGVCSDINSLLFTLADGLAIGASAIVGQKLGEKRADLAIVYSRVSMLFGTFIAFLAAIIMIIFKKNLILMYQPETDELLNMAENIMIIAAVTTLIQNTQWVLTGILRGCGDSKFTAKSSLLSIAIVRPLISGALCYLTPLHLYGAWIGMFIDQAIRLSLNIYRFKSRKWLKIKF